MESPMKFLSAIVLTLALSLPAIAAPPPAGMIQKLEDGGFRVSYPVVLTYCKQPLLILTPQPGVNQFTIYDGPALQAKIREVIAGKYLTFDIAPILNVDCSIPDKEPQKPKGKRFYRSISL